MHLAEQTWFGSGENENRFPRESDDIVNIKGSKFTLTRGEKKRMSIEVTPPDSGQHSDSKDNQFTKAARRMRN